MATALQSGGWSRFRTRASLLLFLQAHPFRGFPSSSSASPSSPLARKIKVLRSYGARARQDLPKLVKPAETGIFDLTTAVSRKYKFEESWQSIRRPGQGEHS